MAKQSALHIRPVFAAAAGAALESNCSAVAVHRTHLRIAAIGDLHVSRQSQGAFHPLLSQINVYETCTSKCEYHGEA